MGRFVYGKAVHFPISSTILNYHNVATFNVTLFMACTSVSVRVCDRVQKVRFFLRTQFLKTLIFRFSLENLKCDKNFIIQTEQTSKGRCF